MIQEEWKGKRWKGIRMDIERYQKKVKAKVYPPIVSECGTVSNFDISLSYEL